MRRCFWVIASALLLILITNPVLAEDIRVPSSGKPALLAKIPDGWKVGQESEGRLNVLDHVPPDIAVTFNLLRDARNPEDFVTQEMRSAGGPVPTQKKQIEIAGLNGWLFESTGKAPSGRKLEIDHYVARLDSTYLIAITVLSTMDAPQSDRAIIQNILASVSVQ